MLNLCDLFACFNLELNTSFDGKQFRSFLSSQSSSYGYTDLLLLLSHHVLSSTSKLRGGKT